MKKNKYLGSDFDSFLEEDGILDNATSVAAKRVLVFQIKEAMEKQGLTKVEMASRMKTSRTAVDRLLDPKNRSITLITLEKAATVLGKKLCISMGEDSTAGRVAC